MVGCVIELKTVLFGKFFKVVAMQALPLAHDILEAGAGQEVLLLEPQLFTILAAVIGIEDHGDIFGVVF